VAFPTPRDEHWTLTEIQRTVQQRGHHVWKKETSEYLIPGGGGGGVANGKTPVHLTYNFSLQQLRFCTGSKFVISHWLDLSLLAQYCRYRAACDVNSKVHVNNTQVTQQGIFHKSLVIFTSSQRSRTTVSVRLQFRRIPYTELFRRVSGIRTHTDQGCLTDITLYSTAVF